MKGIIFTEFLELVEQTWGDAMADQLLDETDLPSGGIYTAVGTYQHSEIISLVNALSEKSQLPVAKLLHIFGEHLFGRFVALYPSFFTEVQDPLDFLEGIEQIIHAEVLKLYPDAELPHFSAERLSPNTLILKYNSPRKMGDFAAGLLTGCIRYFGQPITLITENHGDFDLFKLNRHG